ncbi:MAG: hypothetical protein P8047_03135 [Gammaproteobacteria bacterium]
MKKTLNSIVQTFGFLRLSLMTFVVVDMIARPMPGTTPMYETSTAMISMMITALAPILFMLLLLDAIMTLVYMSSMPAERKFSYRIILLTNLVVAVLFFAYWWPYFRALV